MESLQLSQVLADLSNLGAAEPEAANAIVRANAPITKPDLALEASTSSTSSRPKNTRRTWSNEAGAPPKFDKLGRRILSAGPGSAAGSGTGTPRRTDSDADDDLERASTLMALYDIRAKLKQQDNTSLMRAREKINALASRQQAAERNMKTSEELRRNRYSFSKAGL